MTRSTRTTSAHTPASHSAAHSAATHSTNTITSHEHGWVTESRHTISTGTCVYVRCDSCGARRVDLQEHGSPIPEACSTPIGE